MRNSNRPLVKDSFSSAVNYKLQLELFKESLSFSELRKSFLCSMISEKGFKRYSKSPLRYAGGKSLAVCKIIERFPNELKKLVSPFFGGGSVEIACANELNVKVIGYDLFDILVNYWQIQLKNPVAIYEKLVKIDNTDKVYRKLKEELKKHWKKEIKLEPLRLATLYYFNHNLSYGPGFLGWMSKIYNEKRKYMNGLEKLKTFTCPNLKVKKGSFEKTIPKHYESFLYLDPPYYLEGNSKMFRGIYPQRNFPVHHNNFNHTLLRDLLLKHKGKFVLSYNDCPEVRKLYKGFDIEKVKWQYTLGQGETRIGLNRVREKRDHIKKSHEILIIKE
ncbi:MAG: DNA adenine methylase [Oligoflexia bacterium]|nr:DNA adenine methylase [Oligoflexia bacterium]